MSEKPIINNGIRVKRYTVLPDAARELRIKVFVEEQGFIEEFDATDGISTHFVAFVGDSAIGTCRVFKTENAPSYTLGRLAVCKRYRKNGVGRALLNAAEEYVRKTDRTKLILHAQCAAQGFYERCGYTAYGEIEYEQDSPHTWMKKSVADPLYS